MGGVAWYEPRTVLLPLDRVLVCAWTAEPQGRHRLVPDACIEALWLSNGSVWVCGPELTAWTFELPPGTTAVGVRFRPGVAPLVLGHPASSLLNRRVRWSALFGSDTEAQLVRRIRLAAGPEERLAVLQHRIAELIERADLHDPVADTVLAQAASNPQARAGELANAVGLTPRQLHRRCVASFGYGPATLTRILRFHRMWSLVATAPGTPFAELATQAGYADQAHLGPDCRAITGLTPRRFFAQARPTFPDMSDPFKTATPSPVTLLR